MKKLILLLVIGFAFKTTFAQIPNAGFEILDTSNAAENWGFGGIISAGLCDSVLSDGPAFALSTQAHSGIYAMELRNTLCYATPNSNYAGYVTSQRIDTNVWVGTSTMMPINILPKRINFYYLFNQNNFSDSAVCTFRIYNISNQEIGSAIVKIWEVNTTYKMAGGNVTYDSIFWGLTPDHYTLRFENKTDYSTAHVGTRLLIDDVAFGNAISGINENEKIDAINIYPNPTSTYFNIFGIEANATISIKDITGKEIITAKNINQINTEQIESGIYLVNIKTKLRTITKKILIQH
jgi:hypothetical protein